MSRVLNIFVCLNLICAAGALADDQDWATFYNAEGFHIAAATIGVSPLTSAKLTREGLQITDDSEGIRSERMYHLDWQVDPSVGATAEARLKVLSCSAPRGVTLRVSDGVHGESVTFFPDKVSLDAAKLTAPFDTANDFHTYRVSIKFEFCTYVEHLRAGWASLFGWLTAFRLLQRPTPQEAGGFSLPS